MDGDNFRLPGDTKLWCANRSFFIDLKPFYIGKSEAIGTTDVYYPFVGQPNLMMHLRPALEGYARTIGRKQLQQCNWSINELFVFLTPRFPTGLADVSHLTENFIHEHALNWRSTGASVKTRENCSAIYNRIFHHLHSRYCETFPNLSKNGRPLRYPSIKFNTKFRPSRNVSLDLETYVRRYCLQVLRNIDNNPFHDVTPEFGVDVRNPSHVLFNYLQHTEKQFRGEVTGSWRRHRQNDPWTLSPLIMALNKADKRCNRRIGQLKCGGSIPQMQVALFPTASEIIASIILVTLDLGWIDTAKAFPIDGEWYTTFANDPARPASKEYVALTPQIRPKTNNELWSRASHTREGGSWWVLNRIVKRRERLRSICFARSEELTKKLDAMQTSDSDWDDVRLERDRWRHMERLAFIFVSGRGAGSSLSLANHQYKKFLRDIPDRAEFDIPSNLRNAFCNVTHSSLRHLVAERTLRSEGISAVQLLLGHLNLSTTMTYLKSRQLREELFAIYARVAGIAFDEIKQKATLNRAVIRERYIRNGAQLSAEERRALGGMTLHGARCKNPTSPPPEAGSQSETRCLSGSCIRCPLAVWNWHDELAIPMAVEEYTRLKTEATPDAPISDDVDRVAWEALFNEIPPDLQPRLKAELKRTTVQFKE